MRTGCGVRTRTVVTFLDAPGDAGRAFRSSGGGPVGAAEILTCDGSAGLATLAPGPTGTTETILGHISTVADAFALEMATVILLPTHADRALSAPKPRKDHTGHA
jgi:hypothetical protein